MNQVLIKTIGQVGIAFSIFGMSVAYATSLGVEAREEKLVQIGMSADDVLQLLGSPERRVQFGNQPGETLSYRVRGTTDTIFEIDFDRAGRVTNTGERKEIRGRV